jgi:hypothetical protein
MKDPERPRYIRLRILPGGIPGTERVTGIDNAYKDGIWALYPF